MIVFWFRFLGGGRECVCVASDDGGCLGLGFDFGWRYSPEATGKRCGRRIVVGHIVLGNRGQVRRQLVGGSQGAHGARRQLPDQPLAVGHLVLAVVARQDLDDDAEVVEQLVLVDLQKHSMCISSMCNGLDL